jgi:hypothetical protein
LPCFHVSDEIDDNITGKSAPDKVFHLKTKVLPRKIKKFDAPADIFSTSFAKLSQYGVEQEPSPATYSRGRLFYVISPKTSTGNLEPGTSQTTDYIKL